MSSTSASATASSTACSNLYDTPVHDAVCAMPYGGNHTDIMSTCCKDAKVVSYYNDCGLYCLAKGQTVSDLVQCLYKNGAAWEDVFCRGNASASATATGEDKIPASASASVISSGKSSKTKSSESDSTATSSEGAAPGVKPHSGVSTLGLTIAGLVFSATLFGALQV
ncbi:hypothetical protein B0T10DRAFT_489773 [Thelonectria olida]|uniref:Uncharacterized protein n=1 Tax=Thelonectria olida TaxID=1576542 RepID=A0A9P8W1K0_9HYPO|nr:hypothetical protein B0T10DRAFT_489773 [Thelonectria olida]